MSRLLRTTRVTPANFGKWCFFAGAAHALLWSNAWGYFDWPDWFAVLAGAVSASVAYRLIDRIARRGAQRSSTAPPVHPGQPS